MDLATQCFLEIEDETAEIKDRPVGFQLDEKVNIAIGPCVSSGHRTKHSNVPCSVPCRYGKQFFSAGAEVDEPQRR